MVNPNITIRSLTDHSSLYRSNLLLNWRPMRVAMKQKWQNLVRKMIIRRMSMKSEMDDGLDAVRFGWFYS